LGWQKVKTASLFLSLGEMLFGAQAVGLAVQGVGGRVFFKDTSILGLHTSPHP